MAGSFVRPAYRALTGLYPAPFRRQFRDDLVLMFDEMISDWGVARATLRTAVDLVVTLPQYRMEAVMTETHATQALPFAIAALLALGIAGPLVGLPWVGAAMFVGGIALGIANRSRLARSIRTPDSSRRTRRLLIAGLSLVVFSISVGVYLVDISDDTVTTLGLLLPSVIGMTALASAVIYLVVGLLTPRSA